MKRKPESVRITRGISDLENVFKHLEDVGKQERRAEWLRNYQSGRKLNREDKNDKKHADGGEQDAFGITRTEGPLR